MSRPLSLAAALAGALLAAGCASTAGITPQAHLREPAALAAGRSLADASTPSAHWPALQWWRDFGDPQLDALVDEALAGAPSLEIADARARKAQAQAALADAARTPTVGLGAQVQGLELPQTLAPAPVGGKFNLAQVLTVDAAWNPDFWGESRAKWQAAAGNARAAEIEARAARLTLAANVTRTYIALAQAFDTREAAEAEAARADALVALGEQRVRAGLDNGIALEQNRGSARAARQQAQAAQQQIDALRNALAALAGAGPDRGLAITRPQLQLPDVAPPSILPSDLLAHRPDVAAARWRVDAARHGIDASKAAFYPTINLSALAGVAAGNLGDLFGSKSLLLYGGPALSLPIFEGGRLRAQLRGSTADYDLAVASYNQTLLGAIREVADAVQAARTLDAQIAQARAAREAAGKAHALVLQRQRAGIATQLDALAAQRPLLQFDQQLATLRAQRRIAAVDLEQALGGGIAVRSPDSTVSD